MTPDIAGPTAPRALRVLVTGAAGLLGREVVGRLVERGHGVVALIHSSPALHRNDGSVIPSTAWDGVLPAPGRVVTLAGDVSQPGLGLDTGLAGLDLILHCAALTGFDCDADAYRAVNVQGTANVLAFAEPAGTPVLYVSTAYVCGTRNGPIAEDELDTGQSFANGYEASKAAAEGLVAAAASRGLSVAIARPSIVVGASDTGVIGAFGNIYALIRLVMDGHVRTLPASAGASLDLVPIDYVVAGLVDIAERMPQASGRTFHLVSGAPVPVADLRELALGYQQFYAPQFVLPEAFDPATLTRGERRLNDQVTDLYASYLQRNPHFLAGNLRELAGRTCPPTDFAFLRRLIDYCLATGYVKGRRGTAAASSS